MQQSMEAMLIWAYLGKREDKPKHKSGYGPSEDQLTDADQDDSTGVRYNLTSMSRGDIEDLLKHIEGITNPPLDEENQEYGL